PRERAHGRTSGRPRHFSPADPATNPTEGWNPLDATAGPSAFTDPIESARAAGYAEGLADAALAAGAGESRDQQLLSELAAALRAGSQLDRERMARKLRQTVLFLVTKLVGETGISPDLLADRVETAAELLADAAESALLRLHPDDVALVEGKLPKTVFAAGDASIARGSFVLESASTVVEDGPELWLEQLAQAIDRVPVPPLC
ncbi:MAG: flagellar assembly protein FliH, partial [Pseudomonadota bacterium]|nr:flagellar assembly protein FliH [Pseudomonadota bacterium]